MSHVAGAQRTELVHILSQKMRTAKWSIQLDRVKYNDIELPPAFAQERQPRFLEYCKDFRTLSIQARNINFLKLWSDCLRQASADVEELDVAYPRDYPSYAAYSILNLDEYDFPELRTLRITGRREELSALTDQVRPKLFALYLSNCNMNNIDLPGVQKLHIGKWPTTSSRRNEIKDFMQSDIVRRQAWTNLIRSEESLIRMDRYDELHMNAGGKFWYYNRGLLIISANDLDWIQRLKNDENISMANKLIIDSREPNSSLKVIQTADLFDHIKFLSINLSAGQLTGNSILFDYFLATVENTGIPSLYQRTAIEINLWGKDKHGRDTKTNYLFFEKENQGMETNIVRLVPKFKIRYLSLVANDIDDGEAVVLSHYLENADKLEFVKVETDNAKLFIQLCRTVETEQGIQIFNDKMKFLATTEKVEVTFLENDENLADYVRLIAIDVNFYRIVFQNEMTDAFMNMFLEQFAKVEQEVAYIEFGGEVGQLLKYIATHYDNVKQKFKTELGELSTIRIELNEDDNLEDICNIAKIFPFVQDIIVVLPTSAKVFNADFEKLLPILKEKTTDDWILPIEAQDRLSSMFVLYRANSSETPERSKVAVTTLENSFDQLMDFFVQFKAFEPMSV